MCVFDSWAWRTHSGGGRGSRSEMTEMWMPVTVRQVLVPAVFDPTPREHSFLLRPSRWTEQRGGEAWTGFSRLMALLQIGSGSGE